MPARPGRDIPGRRLPAVLVVVLAALASMLGAPAVAADAASAARSTVGAPAQAAREPFVTRQHATRETRDAVTTRRASRDRISAASTDWLSLVQRVRSQGPTPTPAVLVALALVALAVLRRLRVVRAAPVSSGRTPGGHPGRAPPAYAAA